MKKENKQEQKFINIYAYTSKNLNHKTFRAKSLVIFMSIICTCLILGLLIICLIKFFA